MSSETKTIQEITQFMNGVKEFSNWSTVKADMWHTTKIETAVPLNEKGNMSSVKSHKVDIPKAGRMYSFGYSAKTAKTLPYWDKYPLIICLSVAGNRMQGVNLHYIPPKQRAIFLDIIMKYSSTKTSSNTSYLKINYAKIKNIKWVGHMLKQYLFNHVVQTFEEIAPKDWGKAINLKTQQFTAGDTGKRVSATIAYNDRNK